MALKKKQEPQYTLNIFSYSDNETHQDGTVFLVQTARIFVNFRYEILLDVIVDSNEIVLRILGLHVPSILLPQSGPAIGFRQYNQLHGSYTLKVIKQDGMINEFKIEFLPGKITVVPISKNPFILVSTTPMPLS